MQSPKGVIHVNLHWGVVFYTLLFKHSSYTMVCLGDVEINIVY